jgi:hypothetical protein
MTMCKKPGPSNTRINPQPATKTHVAVASGRGTPHFNHNQNHYHGLGVTTPLLSEESPSFINWKNKRIPSQEKGSWGRKSTTGVVTLIF